MSWKDGSDVEDGVGLEGKVALAVVMSNGDSEAD